MYGPQTPACDELHAEKHRGENENYREAINRVASALQDNNDHYRAYRDCTLKMEYLTAGRVMSAVGSLKNITAFNCFVSGTIHDSFTHGLNKNESTSIMGRAVQAASTMRMGGGIGYDFSTIRPSGDVIHGVQSNTDGPLAFMPIFNSICTATSSAGNRRGAQMGVLRVDHPDIEAFVRAKHNEDKLDGFNLSIAVTDEFMEAVENQRTFDLKFNGVIYQTIDALPLWEMIMRSTYDWAEPGVLFIDTINRMNNLHYCETIAATNPCGEQPLPPFGACLLGSFNLVKFLRPESSGSTYSFDFERLGEIIPTVVRAMDNVVDRTQYPLAQQKFEAHNKRRMGLGMTGVANAFEALGYSYGSPAFVALETEVGEFIRDRCYIASAKLAGEKGSFPLYDKDLFAQGEFYKTLGDDAQEAINYHGLRNSHLTSIAPTGTISFAADNISSGIEPVFAYKSKRLVNRKSGPVVVEVDDYGKKFLGVEGKVAADVTVQEHLDVLIAASKFVDSAVSKTCNLPTDIEWSDFKNVYMEAWKRGAKGCTTYRTGGKREGILVSMDDDKAEACVYDPETGTRTCE